MSEEKFPRAAGGERDSTVSNGSNPVKGKKTTDVSISYEGRLEGIRDKGVRTLTEGGAEISSQTEEILCEASDSRDHMTVVTLRTKKISRLQEENPSEVSTEQRRSSTLEEVSVLGTEHLYRTSNLKINNSVILRNKKISQLREENPSGTSFEGEDSVTAREVSSKGSNNFFRAMTTLEDGDPHPVVLRKKQISRLREENPSETSFEEKDVVTAREMSSMRGEQALGVSSIQLSSESGIVKESTTNISARKQNDPTTFALISELSKTPFDSKYESFV